MKKLISCILLVLGASMMMAPTYPIDGYDRTGIRRLARLHMIEEGSLQGTANLSGALRAMDEIKLNLVEGTLKAFKLSMNRPC